MKKALLNMALILIFLGCMARSFEKETTMPNNIFNRYNNLKHKDYIESALLNCAMGMEEYKELDF